MESHISIAEATKTFSEVIERVRSRGDVFVVECEGEPICRIAPVTSVQRTAGDLVRLLRNTPRPDDVYLDAVEDVAQNQPQLSEAPWEQ